MVLLHMSQLSVLSFEVKLADVASQELKECRGGGGFERGFGRGGGRLFHYRLDFTTDVIIEEGTLQNTVVLVIVSMFLLTLLVSFLTLTKEWHVTCIEKKKSLILMIC